MLFPYEVFVIPIPYGWTRKSQVLIRITKKHVYEGFPFESSQKEAVCYVSISGESGQGCMAIVGATYKMFFYFTDIDTYIQKSIIPTEFKKSDIALIT